VTAAVAVGTQAALAAKLRTARRLAAKLEAARGCLAEQARLACRRGGPLHRCRGAAGFGAGGPQPCILQSAAWLPNLSPNAKVRRRARRGRTCACRRPAAAVPHTGLEWPHVTS